LIRNKDRVGVDELLKEPNPQTSENSKCPQVPEVALAIPADDAGNSEKTHSQNREGDRSGCAKERRFREEVQSKGKETDTGTDWNDPE
jgi:hypothetical protein